MAEGGTAAKAVFLVEGGRRVALRATRVTDRGAFLQSPLLLEIGEEFDIEIAAADGTVRRGRARVAGLIEMGLGSGMNVEISDLSPPGEGVTSSCG